MSDDKNTRKQFWITVLAQALAIILGIIAAFIWHSFLSASADYDKKLRIYVETIHSMEESINDLTTQLVALYNENTELAKRITDSRSPDDRPLPSPEAQRIIDKYENTYYGQIDISLWPELKGQNLSFNNSLYPLESIQSICFGIVEGNAVLMINTIHNNMYRHNVDADFFSNRTVKLRGEITQELAVQQIRCLVFHELSQ
ncbi:MAG: hypothetical protein KAV83_08080 [Desulfobacterales bacterium]|nr:hypothetical protein [Desulfobacterales bacterium]